MPKRCAVLLVIIDIRAPVSMRNSLNIFWGPMGRAIKGSLILPGSH